MIRIRLRTGPSVGTREQRAELSAHGGNPNRYRWKSVSNERTARRIERTGPWLPKS